MRDKLSWNNRPLPPSKASPIFIKYPGKNGSGAENDLILSYRRMTLEACMRPGQSNINVNPVPKLRLPCRLRAKF